MSDLRQAKHPVTALSGWYGHPVHPAVVSVPIGAWAASVVFDVASHLVDDPEFLVRAAAWLLVIGLAGALLAGLVGFLDLVAIPTGTRAFRTGLLHAAVTLLATAVFLVDALLRRTASSTAPTATVPLALSVVGLLVLFAGGFLGGELVFRYGVRVVEESVQAEGYIAPPPSAPPAGSGGPASTPLFGEGD